MSDADRHVLTEAMASASTTAVVDETVCSIVLDPVAMPAPLGAHAPSAISVGSSSKSHWGGLRTGWIRTPGPVSYTHLDVYKRQLPETSMPPVAGTGTCKTLGRPTWRSCLMTRSDGVGSPRVRR